MSVFEVRVPLNDLAWLYTFGPEVNALLSHTVEDLAADGAMMIKLFAPKRTGAIERATESTKARDSGDGEIEATAGIKRVGGEHAKWVEEGTGIFGATGSPIRARPGNFLVFDIGQRTIFTRSVKGQPAQHFVRKAYETLNYALVPARLGELATEIGNL